jgi:hypothetical protein
MVFFSADEYEFRYTFIALSGKKGQKPSINSCTVENEESVEELVNLPDAYES